jgi:uncharacterized protein YfaS (alpha-2-macroglobulin family)
VIAPAWQWFVISDLGVTTLSGVDGLHVFVRSLGTAGAKAGVTVDLLSRANMILGSATTDETGYARFDAGLTRGTGGAAPALVTVTEGTDDIAFLSLTDPEFALSDARSPEQQAKLFTSPMRSFNHVMTVQQLIDLVAFLQPSYTQLEPLYVMQENGIP